jgi:hypothetical protein
VWETACAESKWWTWREEIEGKVVRREKSVETRTGPVVGIVGFVIGTLIERRRINTG